MAEREPEVPEERRIRFRIGVNLGDVIAEENEIFGDGVNVAARLEALADPDGVLVSNTVAGTDIGAPNGRISGAAGIGAIGRA
jgi:class 3 adenylate cyclase